MHTALKISAFAAALAATFGTAYGTGQIVDPVQSRAEPAEHDKHEPSGEKAGKPGKAEGAEGKAAALPSGLQASEGGYTLNLKTPSIAASSPAELRFTVVRDATGRNLTGYEREHDKELHLIVASRDLTVYRHLHPARAADGTWSVPAELPKAGGYRVFADFAPEGAKEGLTLGADLAASGTYKPAALPEKRATADAGDGYKAALDGRLRPGAANELTLRVSKNGTPVRDLQPYLGAYGHLVALRSGDLAYLHVHPNGEPGDGKTRPGPGVSFTATTPSAGTYRLFLDFKHEGKVRTAAFTVDGGSAKGGGHAEDEGGDAGHAH